MWISIHFHIPYMWFVTGYLENLGKPWKALELFRFPRVSMIYDVDFPVDFLWKKFLMNVQTYSVWIIFRFEINADRFGFETLGTPNLTMSQINIGKFGKLIKVPIW